jgi:potassium/hydrogen antiporter
MDTPILIGSLLVMAAILSTRLSQRFGVPGLVLFVGIGMLAGSSGPGQIMFDNYTLSYNIGLIALALILFSGGLDTRLRFFRAALVPALTLSTLGVGVTMLVIGLAAWLLTPLSWSEGLLLGAILAPTDAAATFSVLRGKGLPARLRGVLETESGTNDPVSINLTLVLTALLVSGSANGWSLGFGIVLQLLLGAIFGYGGGWLLVWFLRRVRLEGAGLYPVLAVAGAFFVYSASNLLGGNGFLAIYLTGLVLGNWRVPHQGSVSYVMDALAWGAQIVMFLILGLLVFPDRLGSTLFMSLLVMLVMILLARPVALLVSLQPLRLLRQHEFSWQEYVLLAWAGLKGAVPIILAIIPLLNALPNGEAIFNIVFVVVVVSTALQGLTVGPLTNFLKLTRHEPPQPPVRIELGGDAPPGSAVFDVFLEAQVAAVDRTLRELNLPNDVVIAAIYRGETLVTPRGDLKFEAGDHVFIITSDETVGVPSVFTHKRETRGVEVQKADVA